MDDASFRGDCGRCIGLCCSELSFDRGPHFAFDKPAGERCRHLNAAQRCVIHHRLAAEGMAGCAAYDCLGAGQLVTAMFAGLDAPSVARARGAAFLRVRQVQALRLRLAGADRALEAALTGAIGSYAALLRLDLAAARKAVAAAICAPAA